MVEEKAESEMHTEFGSNFKWKIFLFLLFLTIFITMMILRHQRQFYDTWRAVIEFSPLL